ncbi:MAG: thiamine pyrophosphate-binding protein [Deltaproteobacteria bacterium]|nr:thiamine pyrophosphate-binding protein [Deltaproteobacteria bacterium]
MKGGDLLLKQMHHSGVRNIYGLVGTTLLGIITPLGGWRGKIRYISTRHEQTALSMASAEGRLTGKPGVVLLHGGPGVLNAMAHLGTSFRDGTPLVVIGGSPNRRMKAYDSAFDGHFEETVKSWVRSFHFAGSAGELPRLFAHAWREALEGYRGPAFIEVPEDVWGEEAEEDALCDLSPSQVKPDHSQQSLVTETAKHAAALLNNTPRPLLLLGGGASATASLQAELLLLVASRALPVITTGNGRGAIPETNPHSLGRCGFGGGNPAADYALKNASAILAIGCSLSDMTTYNYTWLPKGEVLCVSQVDTHYANVPFLQNAPIQHAELELSPFLSALVSEMASLPKKEDQVAWQSNLEKKKGEWRTLLQRFADQSPCARFFREIGTTLPKDTIVTAGAGTHLVYANAYFLTERPGHYLASTNFGSMGYALGAAMGAKTAYPEKRVIAVLGDGEFLMTIPDLETIAREKIGIKMIIVNDSAYRVLFLRQTLEVDGGVFGTLHQNPDFSKLASAFGLRYCRGDGEPSPLLIEQFQDDQPLLIEVPASPHEIPPTNMEAFLAMGG